MDRILMVMILTTTTSIYCWTMMVESTSISLVKWFMEIKAGSLYFALQNLASVLTQIYSNLMLK